jgi:aspartyl-tRNA(Asn)/glutamyl-tRNA(Gln) amidotransferase subunit A
MTDDTSGIGSRVYVFSVDLSEDLWPVKRGRGHNQSMVQSMSEAANHIRTNVVTPLQLAYDAYQSLERAATCNAISHDGATSALELAGTMTAEAARGHLRGPLHGIPITVKDLYPVAGMPTRAGTLAPLPTLPEEAQAVSRLRAAGANILAKTNMHEIAAGISGEVSTTGPIRNPHDPARQAGGSSSGSAACVALGFGLASLGSDTAGSIRVPAALCGVTGFKPTWGRIPLSGALALCWTCDHAGPLTRTVADARLMTEILCNTALTAPIRLPERLGVPRTFIDGWLTPGMRRWFEDTLTRLRDRGVTLVDVDIPALDGVLTAYGPMRGAESAHVHRDALQRDPTLFLPPTRTRLLEGLTVTAHAYLDALAFRDRVRGALAQVFADVPCLVLPSTPAPAPLIGTESIALECGPTEHRAAFVRLTLPFSFAGVPALSLPAGTVEDLPAGLQLVAAENDDAALLATGQAIEAIIHMP